MNRKCRPRRRWLRARSGAAQTLLLQLAAVIALGAIIGPQVVRLSRSVAGLTVEAREIDLSLDERRRLRSALGAFARNITVPPRCANPPSDPSAGRGPVLTKDCATWDPLPRRPAMWEQPGRANTLDGAAPEKELCFVTDAQAGNDSPSTQSSDRWLKVLKCVEWHPPRDAGGVAYGYADSTADRDRPGTLVVASYPQIAAGFDPAAPKFDPCDPAASAGLRDGCQRLVFGNVTAFRAFWLSADGEWLHQPNRVPRTGRGIPAGAAIERSSAAEPHAGTEIVRMALYICERSHRPEGDDRAPLEAGGHEVAPHGAGGCTSAVLSADPAAVPDRNISGNPVWDPAHADWDPAGTAGNPADPDRTDDGIAGTGSDGWLHRVEFRM